MELEDFASAFLSGFLATLAAELVMRRLDREKGHRKRGKHFR